MKRAEARRAERQAGQARSVPVDTRDAGAMIASAAAMALGLPDGPRRVMLERFRERAKRKASLLHVKEALAGADAARRDLDEAIALWIAADVLEKGKP